MKTKVVRVYEDDAEKLASLGNAAEVIHELLQQCNSKCNTSVTPTVTECNSGVTEKDVERMIAKSHEKTKEIVTRIMDKHFNSPLTSATLPEGTKDWLVPATDKDMAAVAKDTIKRETEWHS